MSQVAPVLNALAERLPTLKLTIRCGLPTERLRARLRPAFTHLPARSDFGYVMHDAVRIDLPATARAYRAQHANWAQRVADEAALLSALQPQLVLTDVAYLPLAGAAQAGIPAFSMCSLNWADLFAHFMGDKGGHASGAGKPDVLADGEAAAKVAAIHQQMLAAYNSAECFLRVTPGMPMNDLVRLRPIDPIAALGRNCRQELRERLGCSPNERVVLIAFGGFDKRLPVESWPRMADVRWLVPQAWEMGRGQEQNQDQARVSAFEPLGYPFTDLLRSVDAVLTKPGYGTFAEAACNGTPVLFVRRDDWPEQECLIDWLTTHGSCCEVDLADLMSGHLQELLSLLFQQAAPVLPQPRGAEQAADLLYARLIDGGY